MSRTRRSAKGAGTAFETLIATYLATHVDDRIERRTKSGNKDRGDIGGLRHMGQRIVIEAKDYGGQLKAAEWVREAHTEAGNDDAVAGLVVAKRRGTRHPGAQWVLMTLDDLITLMNGNRDHITDTQTGDPA